MTKPLSSFHIVLLLFAILTFSCQYHQKTMLNSHENKLINTVEYLSSPDLDGRASGSKGYRLAADYITQKYIEYGLEPVVPVQGDTIYKQYFDIEHNQIVIPSDFALVDSGEIVKRYILNEDYLFRGFTGSGDLIAPVIFCGYGISDPEHGYDDYADVDVKNKIVLLFKGIPKWEKENADWKKYNFPRVKTRIAFEHGAVGVLFVSHTDAWLPGIYGSVYHGPGPYFATMPQLHISHETGDDLFRNNAHTLKQVQALIDSTHSPFSLNLQSAVRITSNTVHSNKEKTCNVIGMLPGNDPKFRNEYIVVGAHLDHVGRQSRRVYFPGANDNASGIACMLEIANKLKSKQHKMKRSVIFIAFAGEESGLEGSTFFVDNPIIDPHKIKAMINFDCVGRGDSICVHGKKNSPDLYKIVEKHGNECRYFSHKSGHGGGADAQAFFNANIPTLYFVTKNGYHHLHKTSDTVATIDASLMLSVTDLAYKSILDICRSQN